MNRIVVCLLIVCLLSVNGYAYGERGHQLVGAIADKRLAQNQAAARKIRRLLDGLTLERVSTMPDEIRDFTCGRAPSGNRINRELQAFVNANCERRPRHTDFHFTDVPVFEPEEYGAGTVGRADFDIVHLIPFCIRVLKGEEPATNDKKITKTIAVILLAHYLGDIHQPLHVGAEFFNQQGQPFQPATENGAFNDLGGNRLTLHTFVRGRLRPATNLHTYWDTHTVTNAFRHQSNVTVARRFSAREPDDWQLNGELGTWAEQIANGILPTAREAHTRLRYDNIELDTERNLVARGDAFERTHAPGDKFYAVWARDVVKNQIHKGGWRLAALLQQAVQ